MLIIVIGVFSHRIKSNHHVQTNQTQNLNEKYC